MRAISNVKGRLISPKMQAPDVDSLCRNRLKEWSHSISPQLIAAWPIDNWRCLPKEERSPFKKERAEVEVPFLLLILMFLNIRRESWKRNRNHQFCNLILLLYMYIHTYIGPIVNYKTSKGTNETWVEDTKTVKTGEQFKLHQVYHLKKVLSWHKKFTMIFYSGCACNYVCLTKLPGKKTS